MLRMFRAFAILVVIAGLIAFPLCLKGCNGADNYPDATWRVWSPSSGGGWRWSYTPEKPTIEGHCVTWYCLLKGRMCTLCGEIIMEECR